MSRAVRAMKAGPVMAVAAGAGLAGVVAAHSVTNRPAVLGGSAQSSHSTHSAGNRGSGNGSGNGSGSGSGSGSGGAPSTTTPANGTATGAVEQYGYGEIAVKVTVQNGRIVNLAVSQLLTAESYSQSIAQQVIPMLKSEVLSAQSANISAISGATYTSQGYAASVQSALDQLHK